MRSLRSCIVSVRKSSAQAIGKVLKGLGLRLRVVDADHFAAESALRVNYPDSLRRHVALVGIKETRVDISVLKNGNLESYRYIPVHSPEEIIAEVGSLARESGGVFTIVAYGTALNAELLQGIRQEAGSLIEALNPLRPSERYTVFIHMLDASGALVAQRDAEPEGGAAPTTSWLPREIISDPYSIELPGTLAPGEYALEVGLYQAASGKRLPIVGTGADHLALAKIRVVAR